MTSAGLTSSNRLPWVDYVKGINISLIVVSHCNRGVQRQGIFADSRMIEAYGAFTHGVVMALFFFVSGLFISGWAARSWGEFFKDRGKRLVYPYFVWVWIHGLVLLAAAGYANHAGSLRELAMAWYDPPFHFWFLYTIFFAATLYVLLRKLGLSNGVIFALGFLWWVTQDLLPTAPWAGYYLTRGYFVYFAAGAYVGRSGVVQQFTRWSSPRLVITSIVGIGAVLALGWVLARHADDYTRFAMALSGGMGITALATWLQRHRFLSIVEFLGRRSLEIYVAHAMFAAGARAVLVQGLNITEGYAVLPSIIVAGIFGPVVLQWAAQQAGFPYLFTLKRRLVERPVQDAFTVPAK